VLVAAGAAVAVVVAAGAAGAAAVVVAAGPQRLADVGLPDGDLLAARGAGAGDLGHARVAGGRLEAERVDAGPPGQRLGGAALVRQHQRDDGALLAGARGPAAPVEVALVVLGRVDVQHQADVVDVDAAGGDVGADEHVDGAFAELGQDAGALVLALAAVQAARLDADPGQLLAEAVDAVLGAHEDDRAALAVGDLGGDVELVVPAHLEHVVLH